MWWSNKNKNKCTLIKKKITTCLSKQNSYNNYNILEIIKCELDVLYYMWLAIVYWLH